MWSDDVCQRMSIWGLQLVLTALCSSSGCKVPCCCSGCEWPWDCSIGMVPLWCHYEQLVSEWYTRGAAHLNSTHTKVLTNALWPDCVKTQSGSIVDNSEPGSSICSGGQKHHDVDEVDQAVLCWWIHGLQEAAKGTICSVAATCDNSVCSLPELNVQIESWLL